MKKLKRTYTRCALTAALVLLVMRCLCLQQGTLIIRPESF